MLPWIITSLFLAFIVPIAFAWLVTFLVLFGRELYLHIRCFNKTEYETDPESNGELLDE